MDGNVFHGNVIMFFFFFWLVILVKLPKLYIVIYGKKLEIKQKFGRCNEILTFDFYFSLFFNRPGSDEIKYL